MLGERYIVRRGDNLWRIAAATLGRGKEWPRIWHYNNRPEVARVTGRRIPNPDLIYVGQLLIIPRLTTLPLARESNAPAPPSLQPAVEQITPGSLRRDEQQTTPGKDAGPLSDELRRLKIPLVFRFRLGDISLPPHDIGTAVIQMKMSGEVILKSQESFASTVLLSRHDIEAQLSTEANHAFGKLVGENKFTYEPGTKRVTLSSMLISQSSTPNSVATAIGVEMSSDAPLPKLKAEIKLPTLQGKISRFEYLAVDASFSIEVTPRPPAMQQHGLRRDTMEQSTQPATSVNPWVVVLGAGIVVAGVALIVANCVEDVATGGLGLANDPIVFGVSGAMLARGLAMMGVAATAGLPKAAEARIELKTVVEVKGAGSRR